MKSLELIKILKIKADPQLLRDILLHSSITNNNNSYPRKLTRKNEFYNHAGFSILNLLCYLFFFSNNSIGTTYDLSKYIESFKTPVSERFYKVFDLDNYIELGKSEDINRGKVIYSDMVYRLIYFTFENDSFYKISDIFEKVASMIENHDHYDYKTLLQEYAAKIKENISYEIINEEGPDNQKIFTTKVIISEKYAIELSF